MKGEISDTIMVIGILGIVFITVSTAYISLDQVSLPKDEDQTISGGVYEISDDMARLVESCWRQSDKGSRSTQDDCFKAKIYSNDTVSEKNISEMLEKIPEENFGFQGKIPEGESSVKVTYRPVDNSVNISTLSICRPSRGDTCFSTQCSCRTACGPGFDPDGDGNPETDSKGCIKEYDFEASKDPCESLSCPVSDTEEVESEDGTVSIDIGDNLGLTEAFAMERPVPSSKEVIDVESEELTSPREAVGTGSTERNLFRAKASLNVSSLSPGGYGLFIWACDDSSVPENCRWIAYDMTVTP